MHRTVYREELTLGPEYEALLMVCAEGDPPVCHRARIWVGTVHESEPLIHMSRTCPAAGAARRACREMLEEALERLGLRSSRAHLHQGMP